MKLFAIMVFSTALMGGVAQASIHITSNSFGASANDNVGSPVGNTYTSTTIYSTPTPIAVDAVEGSNWSKNTVDFSTDGSQTTLLFTIDHQRTGTPLNSFAETHDSVFFTALNNEAYDLSGFYNVTDVGGTSGAVNQFTYLFDLNASHLSYDLGVSDNTPNEQFILGVAGDGDSDNYLRQPDGQSDRRSSLSAVL